MENNLFSLPKNIYQNRRLILKLAGNDFRTRYAGSYLGMIWAFIQPIVTILVYWFVFTVGFKPDMQTIGIPFVLYLVAGIVPWFFFQDALVGGTNAFLEYHYLVKKVVFQISVLPVVKILAALIVHGFFVLFTLILYGCYGRLPDLYSLQIVYYSFCIVVLVLGICFVTSSVVVFFRDLTQIINIGLQIGIWLTPIMWVAENVLPNHPLLQKILMLNPLYYVVSGYRDAFIQKHWFWEQPLWTLYFWCFVMICFVLGSWVFKRLRPHFADVL